VSEIVLTPAGRQRLVGELEQLRSELRRLIVDDGGRDDTGRERELLECRIAQLEARLSVAEVVEPERDGEIEVGERVTVIDLDSAATTDYRIVGSGEGDPGRGEISHDSPVGSALVGRRVGDVVEVERPCGTVRLEVVEIDG
jgi:transcription elongation factor GreA